MTIKDEATRIQKLYKGLVEMVVTIRKGRGYQRLMPGLMQKNEMTWYTNSEMAGSDVTRVR